MDFHGLARRQLQALCKVNRVPANLTNVAMADALAALEHVEGLEEFLLPEVNENGSPEVQRTVTRTSTRPRKPVVKVQESAGTVSRSRARTARKLDNDSVEDEKKEEVVVVVNTPAVANSRRRAPVAAASRKKVEEPSVQKVYSTRRSVRLVEKQLSELCLGEGPKRTQPAIKIDDELSSDVTGNDVKEEDVKEVMYEKSVEAEVQIDGGLVVAEDIAGAVGIEVKEVSGEEYDLGAIEEVEKFTSVVVGEALKDEVVSSQASNAAGNPNSIVQENEVDMLFNVVVEEEISVAEKGLVSEAVKVEAISDLVSTGTEEVVEDIAADVQENEVATLIKPAVNETKETALVEAMIESVMPENLQLGNATNVFGNAEHEDAGTKEDSLSTTEHMQQVVAQGEIDTVSEFGSDRHDPDSMICQIGFTDGDVSLDDGSADYESEDSAKFSALENNDEEATENLFEEVAVSLEKPSVEEPVSGVAEESAEKNSSSEVEAVHPMTGHIREPLAEKMTKQEADIDNKENAISPVNSKTPFDKMSLRKLEKMLREKLTISNPKGKDVGDIATDKDAVIKHHSVQPARKALKTLPENMSRIG